MVNKGLVGGGAGGGGNAIAEAMQRRGMDVSVLNQVTPTAPTAPERGLPQPVGSVTPSALPPQPRGLPTSGPGGLPVNSGEAQILIKALDSRLKTLSKLDEAQIPASAGQLI